MLRFVDVEPDGPPTGCVIALHGRGVSGEDLVPLADEIRLDRIRWIFPDAPLELPGVWGGREWYHRSPDGDHGIPQSRSLLYELIEGIEQQRTPAERIVLMGFSQGAVMSLDVGVRYPRRLAGIVAMSGYLSSPETLAVETSPAATALPILLTHGTHDDVLPVEGSRLAEVALQRHGCDVRLHEYPIGHQISAEELSEVTTFLQRILKTARS